MKATRGGGKASTAEADEADMSKITMAIDPLHPHQLDGINDKDVELVPQASRRRRIGVPSARLPSRLSANFAWTVAQRRPPVASWGGLP